ncbi:hypothetical protein DRQ09_01620 [candidate division KSB1 bacterium]|nr:MAG: hypothetical protein DRQ09_01620 [candidate division KSB1 bacterium]
MRKILYLLIFIIPVSVKGFSQELAKKPQEKTESDTTVFYYYDFLEYSIDKNETYLWGTPQKLAKVVYKDMTLEAMKITLKNDENILIAVGIPDTSIKHSNPDSNKYIGTPIFTQKGQEPLYGFRMVYNLNTRKGRVEKGKTKFQTGYYAGDEIVRLNDKYIQIRDGYFTTCNKEDHPHFYFKSSKMKLKIRDKIVAKPIILYIADIPVLALPMGVFPMRGGRTSGFIMPSYGESALEGRYLKGMGYYYAPSDYWDAKFLVDFYDKSGFLFRLNTRYAKRYIMGGNISGSFTRKSFGDQHTRRWDFHITHNQQVDPTLKVYVSGDFQSDANFNKNFSLNRDIRSKRRLYSSARIDKRWEGTKNSLSINISREQDLELGNITSTLPSISFIRSSPTYLFRKRKPVNKRSRLIGKNEPWYSSINFSYGADFKNTYSKTRNNKENPFIKKVRNGLQHRLNFSSPQKFFGWLTINPNFSYREEWYLNTVKKYQLETGEIKTEKVNKFATRRLFSFGASANTKIYGIASPNIGNLKFLRHVATPSMSFNYRPDFSEERFGYYSSYIDTAGNKVLYDRFENSAFGRTWKGKSKSINFSLDNLFQAKLIDKENNEKKIDLFNFRLSTGYNFAVPKNSFRLRDLNTSFRLLSFGNLDILANYTFYKFDYNKKRKIPEYLFSDNKPFWKKRFIRLTYLRANTRFQIKGSSGRKKIEKETSREDQFSSAVKEDKEKRFEPEYNLADVSIPWNLSMDFSLVINKNDPTNTKKMFTSRLNLNIDLTKNWKMRYGGSFDILKRKITYHDFSFYRDLHCWELSFEWTPPGSAREGFYLVIRVKDPQLRDLKLEKRDYGGSSIGTWYR